MTGIFSTSCKMPLLHFLVIQFMTFLDNVNRVIIFRYKIRKNEPIRHGGS